MRLALTATPSRAAGFAPLLVSGDLTEAFALAGIVRTLHEMYCAGYLAFECLPLPDGRTAARDAVAHVRSLRF